MRNQPREARVAARIPSPDDGTLTVLPDGRMRTVWSLRPEARWHDTGGASRPHSG